MVVKLKEVKALKKPDSEDWNFFDVRHSSLGILFHNEGWE